MQPTRRKDRLTLNRSICYTTHAAYRDESWNESDALAVLRYERHRPFVFEVEVLSNRGSTSVSLNRQAALVALKRPVATPEIIYSFTQLGGASAITMTTRDTYSRQVTLTADALAMFLGRTQILVPVGHEERTLREVARCRAHSS